MLETGNTSDQCSAGVSAAVNMILDMIKRTIRCRKEDIMLSLYKLLVRPKVGYCVHIWSLYFKMDVVKGTKESYKAELGVQRVKI